MGFKDDIIDKRVVTGDPNTIIVDVGVNAILHEIKLLKKLKEF